MLPPHSRRLKPDSVTDLECCHDLVHWCCQNAELWVGSRVVVEAPRELSDGALVLVSPKRALHGCTVADAGKTGRGEHPTSSVATNHVKNLLGNSLHVFMTPCSDASACLFLRRAQAP